MLVTVNKATTVIFFFLIGFKNITSNTSSRERKHLSHMDMFMLLITLKLSAGSSFSVFFCLTRQRSWHNHAKWETSLR